jgi:hypothetical protein
VSWNSEAGRVRGKIVHVHTKDVNYKGYIHHASNTKSKAKRLLILPCTKAERCGASTSATPERANSGGHQRSSSSLPRLLKYT